jgi:hypothetical protein
MIATNSFDIFDTLLARTVEAPIDIFEIMEYSFPYKNFKELRIKAERMSNLTYDDIYVQFKVLTNESDNIVQKIKDFEFEMEKLNTIPIKSNINKLKYGDIIVSDMYFPEKMLRELLEYHGINLDGIQIYCSASGKYTGEMWKKLIKTYTINLHIGDNSHSDITMANKYGVSARLTSIYKFTELEKLLLGNNNELCMILRKFRLGNPYDEYTTEFQLYNQQIMYNIPLLLFMCVQLDCILKTENRDTVLFLTRDGCLIIKIFKFLYPQYNSIYFHSSRVVNVNHNDDYIKYLKQTYNPKTCILFDLNGGFVTGRNLYMKVFGELPRIFIFNLANIKYNFSSLTNIATEVSDIIENLNYDTIGSLIMMKDGIDYRAPVEFNLEYVKVNHETVNNFIKYIDENKYCDMILKTQLFLNKEFWQEYYKYVAREYIDLTPLQIVHRNMSDCAKDVNCQIKCPNKHELLISNLLKTYNKINYLEIEMNDDSTLKLFREYFHNTNLSTTALSANNETLQLEKIYPLTKIIVDERSERSIISLQKKLYHIIIDNTDDINKQQFTFRLLWKNLGNNGYYVIKNLGNDRLFNKYEFQDLHSVEKHDDLLFIIKEY